MQLSYTILVFFACKMCHLKIASASTGALKFVETNSTLPEGLEFVSAVYDGQDSIYVIGGKNYYRISQKEVFKYSIETGIVTKFGTFVNISAGVAAMHENEIIYVGGSDGNKISDKIYSYCTLSNTTWVRARLPFPVERMAFAWDSANAIGYMFGGRTEGGSSLESILRYDMKAGNVAWAGRVPAWYDAGAIWHGQRTGALILGGRIQFANYNSRVILAFYPPEAVSDTFHNLPYPVEYASAVFSDQHDQSYVVTAQGLLRFNPLSLVAEQLDADSWPPHLMYSAAVYVPYLNRVYVIGGRNQHGISHRVRDQIAYINLGPTGVAPEPPTHEGSPLCKAPSPSDLEFVRNQGTLPITLNPGSAVYNGQDAIYLIGDVSFSKSVYMYSLVTDELQSAGELTDDATGHAIMNGDDIVYFGVSADWVYGIYTFSTVTQETRFVKHLPRARLFSANTWDNTSNTTYVIGGTSALDPAYGTDEIFYHNVTKNEVTFVARLRVGRYSAAAVWDDRKKVVYVFGGMQLNSPSMTYDIVRYDTVSGNVETLQSTLPYEVFGTCAVVTGFGEAYIIAKRGLIRFDFESEKAVPVQTKGWPMSLDGPVGCTFIPRQNRIYVFGWRWREYIAFIDLGPPNEVPSTETPWPDQTSTTFPDESTGSSTDLNVIEKTDGLSVLTILLITTSGLFVIIGLAVLAFQKRLHYGRRRVVDQKEIDLFRLGYVTPEHVEPLNKKGKKEKMQPMHGYTQLNEAQSKPFDESFEVGRRRFRMDKTRRLGSGEFGTVYAGWLNVTRGGPPAKAVAIKVPQNNCPETIFTGLLKELKIMTQLRHDNIVSLLGANTARAVYGSLFIIMELCEEGSIDQFLRHKKCYFLFDTTFDQKQVAVPATSSKAIRSHYVDIFKFGFSDMLRWCKEVATGMEFLATKGVVHRDLAARNVLLTATLTAKVSDFGSSRQLYGSSAYLQQTGHQKLPFRWMALECFKGEFSSQSDVWAYAVFAWEVFAFAELPYAHIDVVVELHQFAALLRDGLRISERHRASPKIFEKLQECWDTEPAKRPSFTEMREFFSREHGES